MRCMGGIGKALRKLIGTQIKAKLQHEGIDTADQLICLSGVERRNT